MTAAAEPQISSRKSPKQARSSDLVAAVLDAAIQVLRSEGARRFTTARVAHRAGVSVGSIYQYFPNKAAILFQVQAEEWARTRALLASILADTGQPADARLHTLVHAFLHSECEEADVRLALADAAPLYRATSEATDARAGGSRLFRAFVDEALPTISPERQALAADLIERTLTNVGSSYSETARTAGEVEAYADALAKMLNLYLASIKHT